MASPAARRRQARSFAAAATSFGRSVDAARHVHACGGMKQVNDILVVLWLAFLVYWGLGAATAKRNVRTPRWSITVRLLFVIVLLVLFRWVPGFRHLAMLRPRALAFSIAGLVVCALGFALAVWARVHLGRNWGTPMSIKAGPELVVTGPYRFVRHPIYSGVLLATLGTALIGGLLWLIIFVFVATYLVLAARAEERVMMREFPGQYPEYRRHTKALVPFLY